MKNFRQWLENNISKALFLVHPDFALDNWSHERYLSNLTKYYQDVINYVNEFDGHVLIHSFVPRTSRDTRGEFGTSVKNIKEYQKFHDWMIKSKAKIVYEKQNLCEKPDDLFNLIDNLESGSTVYWGGGYLGDCLAKTLKFVQDFEQEVKRKNIQFVPVKNLIFIPGATPTTLDQDPDEPTAHRTAYDLGELPDLFQKSIRDAGIHPDVDDRLAKPNKPHPIGWRLFRH
jgi:hypothetical protein